MDKLQILARCLDGVAGDALGRFAKWDGVLVFNYHRIGDISAQTLCDNDLYSASQEGFSAQMAFLSRHFDVISPSDLEGLPRDGKGRHVMVTFDDGYRDNFELAFPVLKAHGVPASFFIATAFLDEGILAWWDEIAWMVRCSQRDEIVAGEWTDTTLSLAPGEQPATIRALLRTYKHLEGARCEAFLSWLSEATGSGRCSKEEVRKVWMTWDMVREMRDGGMTIGGHTVNHPVLSRLSLAEQVREIQGCAKRLREELGEPMPWFAYPVGARDAFNADTRRALTEAGVKYAFSYYGGYNKRGESGDNFDVRRVSVDHRHDLARFRATALLPSLYGSRDEPMFTRLRQTARELL